MRTLDINVQDGRGLIDIAVRQENFTRLRDYLRDCEVAFERRDEALEELAELKHNPPISKREQETIDAMNEAIQYGASMTDKYNVVCKELNVLRKMIKELP